MDSARREIAVFFPEFDVDSWYQTEEEKFRNNLLAFNETGFIHKIISR